MSKRRVVVTGMGAITPLGNSMPTTWSNLLCHSKPKTTRKKNHEKKSKKFQNVYPNSINTTGSITTTNPAAAAASGITTLQKALEYQNLPNDIFEYELQMSEMLPCQVAAPVVGVHDDDANNNKELVSLLFPYDTRTARFVQFALAAANEAMLQADLSFYLGHHHHHYHYSSKVSDDDSSCSSNSALDRVYEERRRRAGVCIGCGIGSVRDFMVSTMTMQKRGVNRINPHFVPRVLTNSASARVAMAYKLQGPSHSVATACAAGGHAIGDAMRFIQYGDADVMLAGGAESCIDVLSLAGFSRLRALSTSFNDTPELASRPFDKQRDGFVMGEGAGILVLEELEHARARGADIICELIGYGLSSDAYHITAPHPDGDGARQSMAAALNQAKLTPYDIDYVNCHATSTPVGDEVEASMLGSMMNQRSGDLFVSSTKGATGHLLGAAGAIEAAFTAMTIADGRIPPTRNLCEFPDIEGISFVKDHPLDKDVKYAVSNSFGFGGTNASLVFAKFLE